MLESGPYPTMDDEPLHEIQLHGKQLVFVVMAATVVAVAVFLCGVMVGRGVPVATGDRAAQPADATAAVFALPDAPPDDTGGETLEPRYSEILDPPDPVTEEVLGGPSEASPTERQPRKPARAASSETATRPAAATRTVADRRRSEPVPAARSNSASAPAAGGFVVQVSAVKGRAEAETIRRRLAGKGYPAFIEAVGSGPDAVFRVRVGHYQSRQAASAIAARLTREERYKTWITR